jgi:hypothetical protein
VGEEEKNSERQIETGTTRGRVSGAREYKDSWKKWMGQGVGAHKDRRKKGVNKEKRVCKA